MRADREDSRRGWPPDAGQDGPAAAGSALFQSDAEVSRNRADGIERTWATLRHAALPVAVRLRARPTHSPRSRRQKSRSGTPSSRRRTLGRN